MVKRSARIQVEGLKPEAARGGGGGGSLKRTLSKEGSIQPAFKKDLGVEIGFEKKAVEKADRKQSARERQAGRCKFKVPH